MKIHSKQLFNYLEKKGLKLDDKMKSEIIELIYFGKNDTGKYIGKEEEIHSFLFYFLCKDNFSIIKLPVFIYLFLR